MVFMKKQAFLTGGSSGIGKAVAAVLKAHDWEVVAPSHTELNLSDLDAVTKYATQLQSQHFDAFVHLAGIWHNATEALAGRQLSAFTAKQISDTMNVGVTSVMVLLATLLPQMDKGAVVGISGTFESGGAGWLPYFTSKRALEDFLVGLSQDMPAVKVYGVSPSDTATDVYAHFYPEYLAESQPPQVVAELVLKLLTGDHGYKSGDIVVIKNSQPHVGFHA
jgi:NAD(P)-dependent dehydrogenase (short-subunit alcohol dehydrogenase family)